jgi:hypothetical protein
MDIAGTIAGRSRDNPQAIKMAGNARNFAGTTFPVDANAVVWRETPRNSKSRNKGNGHDLPYCLVAHFYGTLNPWD